MVLCNTQKSRLSILQLYTDRADLWTILEARSSIFKADLRALGGATGALPLVVIFQQYQSGAVAAQATSRSPKGRW